MGRRDVGQGTDERASNGSEVSAVVTGASLAARRPIDAATASADDGVGAELRPVRPPAGAVVRPVRGPATARPRRRPICQSVASENSKRDRPPTGTRSDLRISVSLRRRWASDLRKRRHWRRLASLPRRLDVGGVGAVRRPHPSTLTCLFFVGRWSVFVSLLFPDRWILSRSRSRRWTSRDVVVATDGSRALKPPPSADHAHRSVAEILFDPVGPFLLPSSSSFHVWFFFSRTFVRLCVSVSFFLYRRRNAREGIH